MDAYETPQVPTNGSDKGSPAPVESPGLTRDCPLANPLQVERTYTHAETKLDPARVEVLCQAWAEVAKAILMRRSNQQ